MLSADELLLDQTPMRLGHIGTLLITRATRVHKLKAYFMTWLQ